MSSPPITILNAPDNLVGIVWIKSDGPEYTMTLEQGLKVGDDPVVPLTRRDLAAGLKRLADAIDAQADDVGD